MATENAVLIKTYEAGEDLSDDQYRIVRLSSGKVYRPDNSTDHPLGVLQNAPASGEAAAVMLIGVSKIRFGEAVAENEWVKLEYVSASDAGNGMDADVALDLAIGRCLKGGGDGELGEVLLSGAVHQVNAAS
jgi:hypothetical protein